MTVGEQAGRILIADDDPDLLRTTSTLLSRYGFDVHCVSNGHDASAALGEDRFDLLLADINMPGNRNLELLERSNEGAKLTPIILITAEPSIATAVKAVRSSVIDYITKPYRMRELVARLRAVLRRVEPAGDAGDDGEAAPLVVGDVALDIDRHEVVIRGDKVDLPLKEFELLALLLRNAGRVLPRDTLIDRVWGHDYVGDTKTLDVHIASLRKKIGAERVETIRGVGFRLAEP